MFNPLAIFTPEALQGLTDAGNRYFVRQSFARGMHKHENIKWCFIMCHYENYYRAKEHYDVLVNDAYRYLYNWDDPADRKKLHIAASQPEGYRVFANLFQPGWEMQLTPRLKEKIRAYIRKLGWKITGKEGIEPQFYPHFGEVYVSLQHRGREVRVNFEEIEKTL